MSRLDRSNAPGLPTPLDFIGIDLAWSDRNKSGVCHARDGRVICSDLLQTDDQVLEWLRPRTEGRDVCIAVDAPLRVENPSGQRACERLISQCFGCYEAGCHSVNASQPLFKDGGRGKRLLGELGINITPEKGKRFAIEVYPHPALVALFDLELSLKYKRKHALGKRQAAFKELIDCLESLGTSGDPTFSAASAPRWTHLCNAVTSDSPARLNEAEDELDAFVCAYVAYYYCANSSDRWCIATGPDRGFIVTPVNEVTARRFKRLSGEATT